MKYLNCIKQWLHTGKIIRETDFLTCCVVLIACFFVGAAIHCHTEQEHLETSGQILHPETENWGLGFGQTGEKPTGNVSAEELKKYHAAYMDPTDEKVIYLTFDAGYETVSYTHLRTLLFLTVSANDSCLIHKFQRLFSKNNHFNIQYPMLQLLLLLPVLHCPVYLWRKQSCHRNQESPHGLRKYPE